MEDNNNISRRDFLKRIGLGAASAFVISAAGPLSAFAEEKQPVAGVKGNMTYRKNRNTGDNVSLLGFGMMRLPMNGGNVDQAKVNELVDYAMAHGVNYYDTSSHYCRGMSEAATGIALKRFPRNSYYIATKLSTFLDRDGNSRDVAVASYEKSFKELQTDYIDYFLIHGVGGGGMAKLHSHLLDIGMLDFLINEKKKGKIHNLGFSFHGEVDVFDNLLKMHDEGKVKWDFIQIQMNYNDWEYASGWNVDAKYLYEECEKRGIQNVVMEPLRGGNLAKLPDAYAKRLKAVHPNDSIASWAFRFVGTHPNILTTLSGMNLMENLIENVNTFSPLDPCTSSELTLLTSIAAELNTYPSIPCTGCEYCMPCPYGVNIPGNFAFYNKALNDNILPPVDKKAADYAKRSKEFVEAYKKAVPAKSSATACMSCNACVSKCPQRIKIPDNMDKLAKLINS